MGADWAVGGCAGGIGGSGRWLGGLAPVVASSTSTTHQGRFIGSQEILRNSGLNFAVADGMKDGAEKAVALAGGAR